MMSSPKISLSVPPSAHFLFPPKSAPLSLPPPPGQPFFDIPTEIFQAALDVRVPVTIAALYIVIVKSLNVYNSRSQKRPWGISKTLPFRVFVIIHNIFLAVYSAWTFVGMFGTLRRSLVSPRGPKGFAATVDSFCRFQGDAGYGNGLAYDDATLSWLPHSPSHSDSGRAWNEGLAYFGWWFYLSKFYEVLDTFIILAKGKLSSTLQTYHHAGAMMCMWAGIRYMSSPIWMFVFVNSGIHTLMYTYYTVTAFDIKVPVFIKRTLTTCQITQFLVGIVYAAAHSFVTYTLPVSHTIESTVPVSPDAADGVKNATASPSVARGNDGSFKTVVKTVTINEMNRCTTSSGETFAIWLNVLYLAPLTYLFMSFFFTSYIRHCAHANRQRERLGHKAGDHTVLASTSKHVNLAEKAGWDAAANVGHEVYNQGAEAPMELSGSSSDAEGRDS